MVRVLIASNVVLSGKETIPAGVEAKVYFPDSLSPEGTPKLFGQTDVLVLNDFPEGGGEVTNDHLHAAHDMGVAVTLGKRVILINPKPQPAGSREFATSVQEVLDRVDPNPKPQAPPAARIVTIGIGRGSPAEKEFTDAGFVVVRLEDLKDFPAVIVELDKAEGFVSYVSPVFPLSHAEEMIINFASGYALGCGIERVIIGSGQRYAKLNLPRTVRFDTFYGAAKYLEEKCL